MVNSPAIMKQLEAALQVDVLVGSQAGAGGFEIRAHLVQSQGQTTQFVSDFHGELPGVRFGLVKRGVRSEQTGTVQEEMRALLI